MPKRSKAKKTTKESVKKWEHDPFAKREASKYDHPVPSREFITETLKKYPKVIVTLKELQNAFCLTDASEKEALRRRLSAMVRDGQLSKTGLDQYTLATESHFIFGTVTGHKDGFGFLNPDDGSSPIFLSAKQMRKVFDGDRVSVRITDIDKDNRRSGNIVTITERSLKKITGYFVIESNMGFVKPCNNRINQDIIIPPNKQYSAKPGQLVSAEIIAPPTEYSYAIAHIVEILGDHLSPGMETEIAIRSYGLPTSWPKMVMKEVYALEKIVLEKDKKNRKDLRNKPFVTIDNESAKDFDDALFCEQKKDGWRLYVAIADVSHYVKPNTAIDREARERGTSVYFPDRVLPMLPEKLSNQLCSLKPNVDRLAMICDLSITLDGQISNYRFYPAIIRSHGRLTYNAVAELLSEDNPNAIIRHKTLRPHLITLQQLYTVLHQARLERGAIDFETPEFKIIFSSDKKIKELTPVIRNEVHQIVEECMLCANESAAKFLLEHEKPALYRIHESPKTDKLNDLRTFLQEFDLELGGGDLPSPKDYVKLMDEIKTKPNKNVIQTVLLRSLTQAFYSPIQDRHFGLAFNCYTHFTSPIRRYPDLIVHRAIQEQLVRKKTKYNQKELEALGEHCSTTERRADEATHTALLSLKCEYMLDKIGKAYTGIVSSVTGFGLFIELQDIFIEGLLHISALGNDYYIFEPLFHRLVGKQTDKIYRIGDVLKVKIADVIVEDRKIDLALAE